jgi:AIPR protein
VQTITYAINSQNPVDLKDLRSGDERQKSLEMSMEPLGFSYRRQRSEQALSAKEISVGTAAEAVLSVWREQPQRAKFRQGELFARSYEDIFTAELNAAQVVIAVLLFRMAENKRKRPPENAPVLIQYASNFLAMLMGRYLLRDLKLTLGELDHRSFDGAQKLIEEKGDQFFDRAVKELESAIGKLYGGQPVGLQQLAATFRRGDLHSFLKGS